MLDTIVTVYCVTGIASNVTVIVKSHVTVAGTVPHEENWYQLSAVAVTVVSPIVNVLASVVIVVHVNAVTELTSTVPYSTLLD